MISFWPQAVDEDGRRAGGAVGLFGGEPGDALVLLEGARTRAEGVAPDGPDEADLPPGAGGGDGLVAAFAAGTGEETGR